MKTFSDISRLVKSLPNLIGFFFVLNGGLVLIVINIGLTIFAFKVQVWYTALLPQCPLFILRQCYTILTRGY